jgi:hypothetical protein
VPGAARKDSVFINCPFDRTYQPLFEVIVFTVIACGFVPRCALEEADAGDVRIEKLLRLIRGCRFAIHDLSAVELNANGLPRFNMPFELGLDLGCKRFGSKIDGRKQLLIMDREQYRYQQFLSDIAGQDIRAHHHDIDEVANVVRSWLRTTSKRTSIPGDGFIRDQFAAFASALPELCDEGRLNRGELQYVDYADLVNSWLRNSIEEQSRS